MSEPLARRSDGGAVKETGGDASDHGDAAPAAEVVPGGGGYSSSLPSSSSSIDESAVEVGGGIVSCVPMHPSGVGYRARLLSKGPPWPLTCSKVAILVEPVPHPHTVLYTHTTRCWP